MFIMLSAFISFLLLQNLILDSQFDAIWLQFP